MVDFLAQNLDDYRQPATVRLIDDIGHETLITEAHFSQSGVTIVRFGTDKKPKQYHLNWIEMLALKQSAEAYQQALIDHEAAKEARRDAIVSAGQTLARSVQFDLDTLNVRAKHDGDGWKIIIPAIGFENYCEPEELEGMVQAALDRIKSNVEYAERYKYSSPEWLKIIASYRQTFPLEPAEILEAKKLLTEAGLTDWEIKTDIRAVDDSTHGYGFFHIEKRTKQEEPEEIQEARRLLKEHLHITDWAQCGIYPGAKPDTWSFDNGQDGVKHHAMFNQPAARILSFVQGCLGEERDQTHITA